MNDEYTLHLSSGIEYPYKIIRSKRSKYLRIKLSNRGELSVTMPYSAKLDFAHEFINSKQEWIEKNLVKIDFDERQCPDILDLRLLGELWKVLYIENEGSTKSGLALKEEKSTVNHQENKIEIKGNKSDLKNLSLVTKLLNQWCRKKAVEIFTSMLENLAEMHGFHYHGLTIRAQKTRWGSCSSKKNINLNCKLLFMPKEIVEYVMVHELCHTVEMNHSSAFWSLVEDCDPKYHENKQQLKVLGQKIPI